MSEKPGIAIPSVGQNGQITIPSRFRKDHSPESICLRLEEAMKGTQLSLAALKQQALVERAGIVRKRYR